MIIDSEKESAKLKMVLSDLKTDMEIVELNDAQKGLDAYEQFRPDLVIMDVDIFGTSGISMAHHLNSFQNPPDIIFATKSMTHALDAYTVGAADYLLKPVCTDRMRAAMRRVCRRPQHAQSDNREIASISVFTKGEINLVPISEIVYLRACDKHIYIRTLDSEYKIAGTLNALEQKTGDQFIRVHSNALIAKKFINKITKADGLAYKWQVHFDVIDDQVGISRRQMKSVREWVNRSR